MRNQDLYNALKELTVRYMDALQGSLTREGELPTRLVPKVESGTNGSLSVGRESKPDFGLLAATTWPDFKKNPDNESLFNDVLQNGEIVRLLTDKGVSITPSALMYNVLQPLTERQLAEQHSIGFREAEFELNYPSFEEYLYSENDRYLLFALLPNFSMSSDEESLGPIKIRKLTREEFTMYNGNIADPALHVRNLSLSFFEFMLEMEVVIKRGSPPITQTNEAFFRWLIGLMKLMNPGSVCYDIIWTRPLSWSGMSFGGGSGYMRHPLGDKAYSLRSQDLVKLREYWDIAASFIGKSEPFFTMAFQRFCEAVDRFRPDDALIDHWIACESLFAPKEEGGGITSKMCTRIGHFLGANPEQRKEIRDIAEDAYRGRGLLLHGIEELDPGRLRRQASEMENITRAALCKCLERKYGSRAKMIIEIDASIETGRN